MYSYKGIENLLKAKNMKKSDMIEAVGLSSRTVAKIGKGEKLSDSVIMRLCDFFGCEKEDIFVIESGNQLLNVLLTTQTALMVASYPKIKRDSFLKPTLSVHRTESRLMTS